VFQFLDESILPDNMLVAIGSDDAFHLGVLSSHIHIMWTLAQGATLEDRPRYTKSQCFDPFPFPDANNIQKQTIRQIAEDLDAHRKRVLEEHPHLTLTGLYNVLEELRSGTAPDALSETSRRIFDDGLVLIIKEYHDSLDAAVADAYGWPHNLSAEQILTRLVALNKERAAEEKRGLVRWLRPDYQIPRFGKAIDQQEAAEAGAQFAAEFLVPETGARAAFPKSGVEQTAAVFAALAAASGPLGVQDIVSQFKATKATHRQVEAVLASLARLGHVTTDGTKFALRRVA
jgi:hypothetical protein